MIYRFPIMCNQHRSLLDANKFGSAYLQKLGWSAGTGLGTTGEGRTSHIKVHQKLDMLGIGAAHQKDPNGLAWKQNRDFENLLRRLNGEGTEEEASKIDGFSKAKEESAIQTETEQIETEGSKKKRKRGIDKDEEEEEEAKGKEIEDAREEKKRKRKERKEKKEKTKEMRAKEKNEEDSMPSQSEVLPPRPSIGRP